jgi:hypothetical protein
MRFIFGCILYFCVAQLSHGIENQSTDNKTWAYVISNDDNLWNIASKFLKKIDYYTDLQKLNNIKYPKRMNPGTVIRIPMKWLKHSPANASISFQHGNSQYLRNKTLSPLTLATKLVLGDQVRIGEDASATVVFADGSEMVLFKNTIVAFDHLSTYGKTGMVDTRVRVIQGKVETSAQKNKGPGSRLDISTPSAISSVRGTKYRVSNNANDISTVEVIEGNVAVAGDEPNNSINVSAGLGTRIEKGKPPTKPVQLLSPPSIVTPETIFETIPTVTWGTVPGAKEYNVQISRESTLKSVLWQQIDSENSANIPASLVDGLYYFRVTAIDALGIEGIPAYSQFSLNLFPKAPSLTDTPERFTDEESLALLSWSDETSSNVNSYVVEIAKDEQFNTILLKETTTSASFRIPSSLSFSNYFWRVSSVTANDKGPASAPLAFNWKTQIKQPNCFVDESSENVSVSWSVLNNNQHIVIQLAKDSEFSEIIEEYSYDNNTTNLNLPKDQELFIRCKATLPQANIVSQWSEVQHVSQIDKGILSLFGFILLIILI